MVEASEIPEHLPVSVCPHCAVTNPRLNRLSAHDGYDVEGDHTGVWALFSCSVCGKGIMAHIEEEPFLTRGTYKLRRTIYPPAPQASEDLPPRARTYLSQALQTLSAPDGAALLAAAAIDAMLKERGLKEGGLHARIKAAEETHLITSDMAAWAHEVRLGSNEVRHSDDEEPHRTPSEAERLVNFAVALGEFLFVLPSRVKRGRIGPEHPAGPKVSKAPPPIEPIR